MISRSPAILIGAALAVAAVWTVAGQADPQPTATIEQAIPVTASVPVTLDDGSVQTVTVPLTVTLNVAVSVDGAAAIGADVAQAEPLAPVADEVTLANAGDFLPALEDMPEGWSLREEGEGSTNEKLAEGWPDPSAALDQLDNLGRTGSYYRAFQAPGFPLTGNATINFSLILFEGADGAAQAVELYRERAEGWIDSGQYTSLSPVSVSGLGENVDAYVLSKTPSTEDAMDGYDETSVTFAKGSVLATVTARSFPGVGDAKQLIDFAKWLEQRLP